MQVHKHLTVTAVAQIFVQELAIGVNGPWKRQLWSSSYQRVTSTCINFVSALEAGLVCQQKVFLISCCME